MSNFSPEQFLNSFVNEEKILFTNKTKFEKLMSLFRENPDRLRIVSDFDYTLTQRRNIKQNINYNSSYCHLMKWGKFSADFLTKSSILFKKYHPMENDLSIDHQQRDVNIKNWFIQNLSLISKERIHISDFRDMVLKSSGSFYLRNGIYETMQSIEKYSIPMYIVSGGIQQIINESLLLGIPNYKRILDRKLIKIVANQLLFNQNTQLVENYTNPIVYTFNKSKALNELTNNSFKAEDNIILLGDHFSDSEMIDHVSHSNCIKIGFFNHMGPGSDLLLDTFKKKFDILVLNDGNMTLLNQLLREIYLH